jgi:3-deoxy-manno-octulosonate cytidylyltransferase (CMP-KDO synthetase)
MFRIIIPARYQSSRLPGKPLVDIGGKPMIVHSYERAIEAGADSVVIATDHQEIVDVCEALDADVFLSDVDHQSGTERIAEVVRERGYADDDIIVNLQGDEPFIAPKLLRQVANALADNSSASMSSLFIPLEDHAEVFNPNVVKVCLDKNNYALYFSRASIPWLRGVFDTDNLDDFDLSLFHRHIGIYGYTAEFVKQYIELPVSPLEKQECLEQLRVLWNGYKIVMAEAHELPGQEVNTPADLDRAREYYKTLI